MYASGRWCEGSTNEPDSFVLNESGPIGWQPLTELTVTTLYSHLKKRSGIAGTCVSAHTCRSSYAVRFLHQGGKPFALQRHLGHESLEMVRVYAHFTDQDAEDEKRKHSPADDVEIEQHNVMRRGFRKGRSPHCGEYERPS